MRRSVVALAALTIFTTIAGCAAKEPSGTASFTPQDSAAVQTSVDAWVNGVLKRDFALFGSSVTPDVVLYPANGAAVRGREAVVEFIKTYPPITAFKVDIAELIGRGDVAFDHGTFTLTIAPPTGAVVNDTGSFATIFKKQSDGTWAHHRVIFHSNLPPMPAAPAPAPARGTRTRE